MNRQEFECDTPDCIHWSMEEGCVKETGVKIEEHCCVDFEEKQTDKLIISVSGGLVQGIYSTLGDEDIKVTLVDFDNLRAEGADEGLREADALIDRAMKDMNTLY